MPWRLKLAHGEDLRFAPGIGWLVWTGTRWANDEAAARQKCEMVSREFFAETKENLSDASAKVRSMMSEKDQVKSVVDAAREERDAAEAIHAFARKSQSVHTYRDMLTHAETFPEMRIESERVDAKPYLLACASGTIDLTTATLRESNREDLLSRASPVVYDASVDTSAWELFLMNAIGEEETVEYLRMFAGYCITGEADQEMFMLIHGNPRNGKSTLVEALCSALGDELTITIDFDTLCRKSTSSQKYDTARMKGIRIVRTSESDKQQRLDEGLVCRWVGGEKVRGRALYEDPFDFSPRFKLMMSVNAKPRINPDRTETGIWDRMACVPFMGKTLDETKRDPAVKRFWTDPNGGAKVVLKWAVSGAADYIKAGRLPALPDMLKLSRDEYLDECDLVGRFMQENYTADPGGYVSCESFRDRFVQWAQINGEQFVLNAQQVADRITKAPWFAKKKRERVKATGQHIHVFAGISKVSDEDAEYMANERAALDGKPTVEGRVVQGNFDSEKRKAVNS